MSSFSEIAADRARSIEAARTSGVGASERAAADARARRIAHDLRGIEHLVRSHRGVAERFLTASFGDAVSGFTLGTPRRSYLTTKTGSAQLQLSSLPGDDFISIATSFDFPVLDAAGTRTGTWLRTIPAYSRDARHPRLIEVDRRGAVEEVEFVVDGAWSTSGSRYVLGWRFSWPPATTLRAFARALDRHGRRSTPRPGLLGRLRHAAS